MQQDVDFADVLRKVLAEALKDRGNVNVLIAGKTGVGKSTLINAIFQGDLATTGQGRPVTPNTREMKKEGIPLTIFDTRGLEVAEFKETLSELDKLIQERRNDPDPNRHIHVAWICIAEDSRRVEEAETMLVDLLDKHVPVIGVVTKARADQGFRAEVQRLLPTTRNVVRVRAVAEKFDDGHELPSTGLKELIDLTMQLVPEGQRNAFAAAQKVSLQQKVNRAHLIVTTAAVMAGGVAATPIPFSDAIALVPIQIGMLAGVSATFGLALSEAFLGTLISGAIAGGGGAIAGRMLLANLSKLIPGAGSLVGGLIAGATATALTAVFGEAYIAALCSLLSNNPNESPTAEMVTEAFKVELSRKSLLAPKAS